MTSTDFSNRHNKGTLKELREVAAGLFEVIVAVPKTFHFKAGQYIWLAVFDAKGAEIGRRAFSITSATNTPGQISLLVGASKSLFKQTLLEKKPGEEVLIIGPFGSSFLLPGNTDVPLVLFAGGVGVAPFLGIIREALIEKAPRDIHLVYTDDEAKRLIDTAYFGADSSHAPKITIASSTKRITPRDLEPLTQLSEAYCYVSGPQPFVDVVNEMLLKKGILPSQIIFEALYPSSKEDAELTALFQNGSFAVGTNAKSKIAQQLELITQIIENNPNHIIITSQNGLILYANSAAQAMTGFSLAEMLGNTPRLWGGLMHPSFYKKLWKNKLFGDTIRDKIVNRKKNGEIYYVYSNIAAIKNEAGALLGWIATEENITELELNQQKLLEQSEALKNSEKALMNVLEDLETEKANIEISQAKTDAILSSVGDGLVAIDEKGNILFTNSAFESLLGWKSLEVIGRSIFDVLPQENELGERVPRKERALSKALNGTRTDVTSNINSAPDHHYYFYIRKDGTRFPTAFITTPILFNKQNIGAVMVFRNIEKEKALENAKSEFVSIASHQLRTPLTGIRWVSEYLLKKQKLSKKSTEYLQDIHTSTARLSELLDILLNLSRIEEGAIGISPQPLEVVDFLRSYLEECRPLIDKKELSLTFSSNRETITAETDTGALRNIIQSIVSNAIEYTPAKGTVSVSIEEEKANFKIVVRDSGIGIPLAEQHKIFTKFNRASNAQKVKAAGTGLGAYIAKEAAEMLGGTIDFISKENEGTTFTVILPLHSTAKEGLKTFSSK